MTRIGKIAERLSYALSVRQPYAEQILRAEKQYEFRSWPTNRRGRVYLYASLTRARDAEDEWSGDSRFLPRGVIVGSVEIVDCEWDPDEEWKWRLVKPWRYDYHIGVIQGHGRRDTGDPSLAQVRGYAQPGFWRVTI